MEHFRGFPSDFAQADSAAEPQESCVAAIGTDERRMHVRAYNYWVSLLDGRDFPSIEDLEPADLADFAPNSILLDFTGGRENPSAAYIGAAIRDECGLPNEVNSIADVPSRSLLSRLTDHYLQIIANRAPVGFEAEFDNHRDETICYRGILMPFSSDGDTIDFIYGVMNWKKLGAAAEPPSAAPAETIAQTPVEQAAPRPIESEADDEDGDPQVEIELGDDAGLADRLWAARECAEAVKAAEGRSRDALYRALDRAYDFALASRQDPEGYAELLEESGVKAQARAPMTPIVKLVFGINCEKARLTEYAAALSFADRRCVGRGEFLSFIEAQAGGLKALVAAEREARRPGPKADTKTDRARERLRKAAPVALEAIAGEEEFALVLTRRSNDGRYQAIAVVDDAAMIERAIRHAGG